MFSFHGCIFLFVVLISQLRVVWEVSNTNTIWFSVYFYSHPMKIPKIKSVKQLKLLLSGQWQCSLPIFILPNKHIYFLKLCPIHFFFPDVFYLIRRSISKDTLLFFFFLSIRQTKHSSILCLFALLLPRKQ